MKVVIRTDAALHIGSGHIMRCKTLADEMRRQGAEIQFVCREYPGNLISLLRDWGYSTSSLPMPPTRVQSRDGNEDSCAYWLGMTPAEDAAQTQEALEGVKPDWLVVDHYGIDTRWECLLRPYVDRIMVIDDLANRKHHCDLLLDQNLYAGMESRYNGFTPPHTELLLGPRFALLRPEFRKARETLRDRDGEVRRILVFFGGVDRTQQTENILDVIEQFKRQDIMVEVVVGVNNPRTDAIRLRCAEIGNFHYHQQISNMAELMAAADLAIGAGGSASWERCAVGLPSILVSTAENQLETTASLEQAGAAWHLGWQEDVTAEMWTFAIQRAFEEPTTLRIMGRKAFEVMGAPRAEGVRILLDAMSVKVSHQ